MDSRPLAPGVVTLSSLRGDGLLTWEAGSFHTAPDATGSPQVVTVDDFGTILGVAIGTSAGQCVVEVRTSDAEVAQASVPVARADKLLCNEVGLALATPSEIHGDVSGQPETESVVRRTSTGRWVLAARPPVTAPGLDVYPDDPARAIWSQVTANTRGDLVAVGSPDRQRVTVQRYDRLTATMGTVTGRARGRCPHLSAQHRRLRGAAGREGTGGNPRGVERRNHRMGPGQGGSLTGMLEGWTSR